MTRGKGTILQRIKDGVLSDVRVFTKKEGLTWLDAAGRTFTLVWCELRDWVGQRSQAGRIAPKGFPRSNKFGPPGVRLRTPDPEKPRLSMSVTE